MLSTLLLKFFHTYRTWWLQGLVMKYEAFCFQVNGSNVVQVDSAKDYSHWISEFDGLCKMHWFPNPCRQVCISHKATVTADTNWYPCRHSESSQKLNGCRHWARCCQCPGLPRAWLWGSKKPMDVKADWKQEGVGLLHCSVFWLALEVMATQIHIHRSSHTGGGALWQSTGQQHG